MRSERVKISLFSQSLFALSLEEAVSGAAEAGFEAIELACAAPHLDLARARQGVEPCAAQIEECGLTVSALSLFNQFTKESDLEQQVEDAEFFIRLSPLFGTRIVKLTPGPPASAEATAQHWGCLGRALEHLDGVAAEVGVQLAVETHMRQLTDTVAGTRRMLEMAPSDRVGVTVDFSNLAFAGDDPAQAIEILGDRVYNTHIKNGTLGDDGSWKFCSMNRGLTDYGVVLRRLRETGYGGYLTLECLQPEARTAPIETAQRDLEMLKRYLNSSQGCVDA